MKNTCFSGAIELTCTYSIKDGNTCCIIFWRIYCILKSIWIQHPSKLLISFERKGRGHWLGKRVQPLSQLRNEVFIWYAGRYWKVTSSTLPLRKDDSRVWIFFFWGGGIISKWRFLAWKYIRISFRRMSVSVVLWIIT